MATTVSIIGAGNSGCAFAADLEHRGIRTLIYGSKEHPGNTRSISANGCLEAYGKVEGRFHPRTSHELLHALEFSRYIIITVPSFAQDDVLQKLQQHDLSQHVLIFISGNLFSLVALRHIRAMCMLETSASPFGSRMVFDAPEAKHTNKVQIFGRKTILPIAAWPSDISEMVKQDLQTIFPVCLKWSKNIIEVSFYNFNGVLHPITAVMNAGWIENTEGDFHFYSQGMTGAVTSMMNEIDKERIAVAGAYGFGKLPSCLQQMNAYYDQSQTSLEGFAARSVHGTLKLCPKTMQHRYLTEDIPYVMVPWLELARLSRTKTPFMNSLVRWASVINNAQYLETGRTLGKLGIEGMLASQVLRLVNANKQELEQGSAEHEGNTRGAMAFLDQPVGDNQILDPMSSLL